MSESGRHLSEKTESVVSAASAATQVSAASAATQVSAASSGTQRAMEDGHTVLAPMIPAQAALEDVSVLIDPIDMQTIACTVGFRAFTGPLVLNCPVADFVENYGRKFTWWVSSEVNARIHDEGGMKKFKITLKPTARQRPRFEFKGDAYIIHAQADVRPSGMGLEPAADEHSYNVPCVLAVRNIKSRWTLPSTRLNDGPALMDSSSRGNSMSL